MEQIKSYATLEEAIDTLDNGGRFFDIFTKANDGVISAAELGKVGKVFNDKQKMILFLELSSLALPQDEKDILHGKLDAKLEAAYQKYQPTQLSVKQLSTELEEHFTKGDNIITQGIPKRTISTSNFMGSIMVPIMVDGITTFSTIPIIEEYNLYELHSNGNSTSPFLIAHNKEDKPLPEREITVGGVIKEMTLDKDKQRFIEVNYYLEY